jgi:tetratricopeptide (TPR) repeat protein
MKSFLQWLATAATLTFAVPLQAGQNDPRLDGLFAALGDASSVEEAAPVEQEIWKVWLLSGSGTVDAQMLRGLQALSVEDNKTALAAFTKAVEAQPDFAEAWNKRATVYYLLGRYDASVIDIHKTLTLEPRHFGALSGLALINLALGREREALKAFEAALRIHPNMPGADTHIRDLREKIKGKGI